MQPFTTLTGVAAPLRMINVDTDMIIPKQYLKTIKRTGLGKGLFSEMRYNEDGRENPDFVLNKPAYRKAQDPRRRRQFRLRLEPRARALGAARFRHPLRHLDELRRHFLQQLLQERHPADHRVAGGPRQADGRRRARRQRDDHRSISRTRRSAAPTAAWSVSTSTRSEALPAQRARRDRPDHGKARPLSTPTRKRRPRASLGLSRNQPQAPSTHT